MRKELFVFALILFAWTQNIALGKAEIFYPNWLSASQIHGTWTCPNIDSDGATVQAEIDTASTLIKIVSTYEGKVQWAVSGHYSTDWRNFATRRFLVSVSDLYLIFYPDGRVNFSLQFDCTKTTPKKSS